MLSNTLQMLLFASVAHLHPQNIAWFIFSAIGARLHFVTLPDRPFEHSAAISSASLHYQLHLLHPSPHVSTIPLLLFTPLTFFYLRIVLCVLPLAR